MDRRVPELPALQAVSLSRWSVVAPFALGVTALGVTGLVLRPNMWLALQADGAFYQSLSENGGLPMHDQQDLSYFPQRLSLLVPERLLVLLLGPEGGYLAFRYLLAGLLTCLAVWSLPRSSRWPAAACIGVVCATTPPAIGWLSQNYPTVVMGPAVAAAAVSVARLTSEHGRQAAVAAGSLLGVVVAVTFYGHWGVAYLVAPLFAVAAVVILGPWWRSYPLAVLGAAAGAATLASAAIGVLGLALFDLGTPSEIWAMNMRGRQLIESGTTTWSTFADWTWTWWQTSLALWGLALSVPFVLRLRAGSWDCRAVVLATILACQMVGGAVLDPLALANTQYNLLIWPLALVLLAHGVGGIVSEAGGRSALLVLGMAIAAAWAGLEVGSRQQMYLKAGLLLTLFGVMVVAMSTRGLRRLGAPRSFMRVEPLLMSTLLIFLAFLLGVTQRVPLSVSENADPSIPPMAWIDYGQAYGKFPRTDYHHDLYVGAATVSEAAYDNCPVGSDVEYWISSPTNGYLSWALFGPFNSSMVPYPEVPDRGHLLCLVAIGSPEYFAQTPGPAGGRAILIAERPLRDGFGDPDLADVVRVYLAP